MKTELISFLPTNQKQIQKRNFGIDIVRILSMLFIINLHIIYHGGLLFGAKILTFKYNLFLFFVTLFSSGVDIFGMISGFVGFHSHKYSNLIYLLFETFLYNFGIAYAFKKKNPNSVKDLSLYLYPLFISNYWYFNAYFIMYFFLPLINSGINSMDRKGMGIFILSVFFFFSCFNQIRHYSKRLKMDFFCFAGGFRYMWLMILYFYGGYLGRFFQPIHNYNKLFIFLLCCFVLCFTALSRSFIIIYKIKYYKNDDSMIAEYTSPSSVIISICLIIIFCKLDIKSNFIKKAISFFSPLTFGVYLLHNHVLVRNLLIKNNFIYLLKYSSFLSILLEIMQSVKIYIICSFIDYLRFLLFKMFKIRYICIIITNIIRKFGNKILYIFGLLLNN